MKTVTDGTASFKIGMEIRHGLGRYADTWDFAAGERVVTI